MNISPPSYEESQKDLPSYDQVFEEKNKSHIEQNKEINDKKLVQNKSIRQEFKENCESFADFLMKNFDTYIGMRGNLRKEDVPDFEQAFKLYKKSSDFSETACIKGGNFSQRLSATNHFKDEGYNIKLRNLSEEFYLKGITNFKSFECAYAMGMKYSPYHHSLHKYREYLEKSMTLHTEDLEKKIKCFHHFGHSAGCIKSMKKAYELHPNISMKRIYMNQLIGSEMAQKVPPSREHYTMTNMKKKAIKDKWKARFKQDTGEEL